MYDSLHTTHVSSRAKPRSPSEEVGQCKPETDHGQHDKKQVTSPSETGPRQDSKSRTKPSEAHDIEDKKPSANTHARENEQKNSPSNTHAHEKQDKQPPQHAKTKPTRTEAPTAQAPNVPDTLDPQPQAQHSHSASRPPDDAGEVPDTLSSSTPQVSGGDGDGGGELGWTEVKRGKRGKRRG